MLPFMRNKYKTFVKNKKSILETKSGFVSEASKYDPDSMYIFHSCV